jgi:hypothetical protein
VVVADVLQRGAHGFDQVVAADGGGHGGGSGGRKSARIVPLCNGPSINANQPWRVGDRVRVEGHRLYRIGCAP